MFGSGRAPPQRRCSARSTLTVPTWTRLSNLSLVSGSCHQSCRRPRQKGKGNEIRNHAAPPGARGSGTHVRQCTRCSTVQAGLRPSSAGSLLAVKVLLQAARLKGTCGTAELATLPDARLLPG